MSQPITALLIGAGNRGADAYGSYALAHPDQVRFVAVAEPNEARRSRLARNHHIPPERQYLTWQEALSAGQIADAALVCTHDTMHVEPAVAALEAGYDVLLEKPMATTLPGCVQLVQAAERSGRLLQICHVLRYAPFFSTVHELIVSGRLGEVITVEHRENVSYWHMAHSYVRGNWRRADRSSPMILAKCCHDLDLLYWFLGPCTRLSSVGSLRHYRAENAPPGAPARCTDGCPHAESCPWYAPRLYMDLVPVLEIARHSPNPIERLGADLALDHPRLIALLRRLLPPIDRALDYRGWPVSVLSEDTRPAARRQALETGPYGRCIYRCDNDVVDNQVVDMAFASGASAALIMHGHAHREGRTLRIDGTRATMRGRYYTYDEEIEVHDHLTGRVERIRPHLETAGATGHGGGDGRLMAAFVRAVRGEARALTTAREALESHLMAFAAEEARLAGRTVELDELRPPAPPSPGA